MSDYSTRYLVPTYNGLMAQIGLSAGVSVVCIGVFEWNRRKKTLQYLYSPRCRLKVNPTPPMSMKFLGWIKPTITLPEEFYIANVGLDAVMFLRFLKMCLQFCIFNAIIVGIILLPIHYFGDKNFVEVPRFSILNIQDDSNLLWAHVLLTYVVTVSWMFLLFKNYWQWMDLRREYTLQRIRQGEIAERSIFVSRLPSNLRSDAALKQYFESLKMGPVESATVVQHCGRLSQKIDRRESALNMLEKAHIELAREVLDSIKHGKFLISSPVIPTTQHPLLHAASAPGRDSAALQSIDFSTLGNITQEMYRDKKLFNKIRKSIFARKRIAHAQSTVAQPQLNIPLSALSQHSDIIDVYVHGEPESDSHRLQPKGSNMSLNQPGIVTIWNMLAALDRRSLDKYQPTRTVKRFKGGDRVLSIDYLVKKYNKLDRKVGELRDGSLRYKSTSYGFVTFKHHLSAQLCAQAKIDSRPQGLSVRQAMEPRDVLWSNLTASFRNQLSRTIIVNLSIWVLIIFWIFPTSSFLLLTSVVALSEKFQFLKPILDASPFMLSLLQNVLPIVFVNIFLGLAPVIIVEISKQELPVSYSALEGNVFRRYYHFLIFNVLFVFMIGTAILKSIITLIQVPTNIFTMLAETLPSGATFFVFYIVFNTCTHALELVQVWAQLVIHGFVTARKLTPTPRSLQRATVPWCFQYYYYYPQNILAIVITIIYSVINPLILIAAVPFFAFALLVFKYQLAYCYIRKYENSGKFFRHVFQYTTDGLIIFQFTMVGVLWLKHALVGGFVVVVLIGLTVYFKILCGNLFKSRTKFLPLDTGLRNFDDDDSSCAMNEIPASSEVAFGHSSAFMDSVGGIRHRSLGVSDNGEHYDDHHAATAHAIDTKSTVAKESGEYAGPFRNLRESSQSDRYQKIDTDKEEDTDLVQLARTGDNSGRSGAFDQGYDVGVTVSAQSSSNISGNLEELKESKSNHSRNSLALKIQTKDMIDPTASTCLSSPSPSKRSSTKEITLFTVGDEAKQEIHSDEQVTEVTGEVEAQFPAGFLDEHGFYLENYGMRNSGMACRPLASHFEHWPSKISYQDRTSDFETYIHPALLKPLNRKLWLPRNPLYEHWDLDDTVEIDFALNSSSTMGKLEFRVQEKEDLYHSQSPRQQSIDQYSQHPQRRGTAGSNFENGASALPSPSNWQGCLSDSPPNTAAPAAGSQWDNFDEKQKSYHAGDHLKAVHGSAGSPVGTGAFMRAPSISSARSRHGEQGVQHVVVSDYDAVGGSPRLSTTSPKSAHMTHSASMSSMRFAPSSPRPVNNQQLSPHALAGEERLESFPGFNTRYRRSASMPPAPLAPGELPGSASSTAPTSPHPIPSPFLSVRSHHHPHSPTALRGALHNNHGHRHNMGASSGQGTSSANQSPRVSFVHDSATGTVSSTQTPLTVRSTMFSGPLTHRHTISHGQGNNIHNGPGNRTPGSIAAGGSGGFLTGTGSGSGGASAGHHGTTSSRKVITRRGTAGAFFNMLFGDPDDDILDADENPRFGYETGGVWSRRRGSIDHHDDDDDDDDDDDEEDDIEVVQHSRHGTADSSHAYTTVSMTGSGPGAGHDQGASSVMPGELRLALEQPSHLDLAETATTTTTTTTTTGDFSKDGALVHSPKPV
ncbi:hypothetical protein BGZ75_006774 [Mortierella antarctica]|nr:hypothetical protein BGZ75_006774 [Mortierella antarctica]